MVYEDDEWIIRDNVLDKIVFVQQWFRPDYLKSMISKMIVIAVSHPESSRKGFSFLYNSPLLLIAY